MNCFLIGIHSVDKAMFDVNTAGIIAFQIPDKALVPGRGNKRIML